MGIPGTRKPGFSYGWLVLTCHRPSPGPGFNTSESRAEGRSHKTPSVAREGCNPWMINFQKQDKEWKVLIDRGANGGIAGKELRVIDPELDQETIDMCGIDNRQIKGLKTVSVGVVDSTFGEIIIILHQQARMPDGKTIL
jgi:hypothetical protein